MFVQDQRISPAGIFAAYADVSFDNPDLASIVADLGGSGSPYLHNTTDFGFGINPAVDQGTGLVDSNNDGVPDQIDALGSFTGNLFGTGGNEVVLAEWAMTAEQLGTLQIVPEPTTEPVASDPNDADQSTNRDTSYSIGSHRFAPASISMDAKVVFNLFQQPSTSLPRAASWTSATPHRRSSLGLHPAIRSR